MSSIDRWNYSTESHYTVDEPDLPMCEHCGEECCIGLSETIFIEEEDIHFCSVSCLMKHDEIWVVQALGGIYI